MKKHKCCMAGCKYKHLSLICVLHHMFKEHKLRINGKPIHIRSMDVGQLNLNTQSIEEVKDGLD